MLLHFLDTYQGLLQEEEGAGRIIKDLYLLIMKDESLYQDLREDTLRLHQLVETVELKIPEESQPPSKQVKPLFRHFRRIDSCLQTRVAFRGSDEIFCRVYMPDHSYVTIRSRLSASVQDILGSVTEKLQYSEEPAGREDSLILVAVASSGEKVLLQPTEDCVFTTLGINSHLFACTRDSFEALVPLPEEIQVSPGDTEIHRGEPEDVANHLTAFHWELFRCVHELEFVDYVFHGERGRRETANLELLLQRCSEVTHWVATEVLLCEAPGKRAQLLKKFIKIAAICKQNQDLLSFYAVVMGLDNAAVSRLRLTWEKLPGKFKNLFRKFENLTDPCRNHKSYREVISKMKPPVIPFVPLILKDLTFLHEGSKTLVDGLVNIEKLHSVAEKVRTVRKYRSQPLCLDMEASPHHLQTKAYVRQFQVIDNQNLLFELSYKLEANIARNFILLCYAVLAAVKMGMGKLELEMKEANTEPPKLSRDEQRGRGALLQDICKGTKLKKVTNVNDRSAPILEKPKGSSGGYGSGAAALQAKGGLFQGGVPKLRPVGAKDSSENLAGKPALQVPSSRAAAPRPPGTTASGRPQDDTDSSRASLPELPRTQRPSLPDLSRPNPTSSTGMKHSSSAPPPPPPGRRANAPPTPLPMHSNKAAAYNREKPLPPTPGQRLHPGREGPSAPPPVKPPPSPVNVRSGPSGQSLAPPPPPYRQPPGVPNGPSSPTNESAPELPQRHNSLHRKTPGPARGLAPPPPTSASPSSQSNRPPPPTRDPPSRGAAPPPPPPMIRNGARDAPPPPPPYRVHGSEPLSRGKPPPPPSRTPAGPPPPPPPLRNGHRDSITTVRSFLDDFESKYSFHPVEDFPAPEEYKHFQRIYPSKTNRAARGAPPQPPILRKLQLPLSSIPGILKPGELREGMLVEGKGESARLDTAAEFQGRH
ncbi:hypothetical protein E5288_WYG003584 [Bos mutus]|uniref:Ras-GEF domain-containing protein n=1 Tax=Bos mutus TaxID=72004 RepID=A0A6B0S157_9CETA|nr:hypothetical protein [Bos mutus]